MAITPRMMIQSQLRSTPFRRRQWRAKSQRHKISSPNRRSHCRFGCLLRGFVRGCGWDWPTGKYLLSNSPPRRNVPKIRLLEVSKIRSSVRHRRARVMWGGTLLFFPLWESGALRVGVFEWLLTEKRRERELKHQLSGLTNLAKGLIVGRSCSGADDGLARWTKRITQFTQLEDNWTIRGWRDLVYSSLLMDWML